MGKMEVRSHKLMPLIFLVPLEIPEPSLALGYREINVRT
jgi:hypothetical protein